MSKNKYESIFSGYKIPDPVGLYLINQFGDIAQIFFVGSRAKGRFTDGSDYDFILIKEHCGFEKIVIWVEKYLLDISIHTYDTLFKFMEIERRQGSCGLANALSSGFALKSKTEKCNEIILFAKDVLKKSPPKFNLSLMKSHILGSVFDLRYEIDLKIKFSLIISLTYNIIDFVLKSGNAWAGEGRFCVLNLDKIDDQFLDGLKFALNKYYATGSADDFIKLIEETVIKYTGDANVEMRYSCDL